MIEVLGEVPGEALEDCPAERIFGRKGRSVEARPSWARWNGALEQRYTIGVEEEVMLLDRLDCSLAQSSERVLGRLSDDLREHTLPETHAAVIELATGIHVDVAGAVAELAALRAQLAGELGAMGLGAASAGTYPLACSGETRVSGSKRYRMIADSIRALARREITLTVADSAALIALVQSLARRELQGEPMGGEVGPEVLAENRFLAARDGLDACLIDVVKRQLVPVRALVESLLVNCRAHAAALACSVELDHVRGLAAASGADRQRVWASEAGLVELVSRLSERFAAPSSGCGGHSRRREPMKGRFR